MNAETWIKIHRKILISSTAGSDEILGLFVRILLSVNWKSRWWKNYEIKAGQLTFAWRQLPERFYPSADSPPAINTIRTRLTVLESLGIIKIEPHPSKRFSVLTVLNWGKYQGGTVSKTVSNSDTVLDTVLDTVPDTERRRNKKEKNVSKKRFVAPTVEEVKAYCLERKNNIDPEQFVDWNTSKGWKVGREPMKDWKAAIRTWEKRSKNDSASREVERDAYEALPVLNARRIRA